MNTYEKVINYLEKYKKLGIEINVYRHKMGGKKSISYSQEEKGTPIDDMMVVYMQKIEEAEKERERIKDFVNKNFDGIDKIIIYEKFINDTSYIKIGEIIGYDNSYCGKLMKKAIYKYLSK